MTALHDLRSTTVAVIGLGYVGLPLAVDLAGAGARVVGYEIDAARVGDLAAGSSHVEDVSDEMLRAVQGRLRPTTDASAIAGADVLVICVPTPLSPNREPDLGPLHGALDIVRRHLSTGQLVILESTTYPGTTREVVASALEQDGMVAGQDFAVAFSPERVDPGRDDPPRSATPKIVGGLTAACTERAAAFYSYVYDNVVVVSSCEAAELSKLLENIFRSVNIALINELAMLADRMDINIWEVIDAAATKPYGFMRFEPGPGLGGHCIPIDPFYLTWRARKYDFSTEFIELAGKINQNMPYYCVGRIERALNDSGRAVRGARILVVGVAYKGGVADRRESPALKIMELLERKGARLLYHDPHIPELGELGLRSEPDAGRAAAECDLALVVTAHPSVDHDDIARRAPQALDLRNAISAGLPNVERL